MSLFVGNLSRSAVSTDLHSVFNRYGRCSIDRKGCFAFIDFENLKSAEFALSDMKGKDISGIPITVEWSKKTRSRSRLPEPSNTSRNISKSEIECYYCRRIGHISKECKFRQETQDGCFSAKKNSDFLEGLKKEGGSTRRIRIKSPDRYQKVLMTQHISIKLD